MRTGKLVLTIILFMSSPGYYVWMIHLRDKGYVTNLSIIHSGRRKFLPGYNHKCILNPLTSFLYNGQGFYTDKANSPTDK